MNILPQPKAIKYGTQSICIDKINWIFENDTDKRVADEANRICPSAPDGFPIYIKYEDNSSSEGYELNISPDKATISSKSAKGTFYALQTLKQLLSDKNRLTVCQIVDEPDTQYRGFYHDVTRGKVPTLDTLKELVDKMAYYKMNSLQLYIEHSFEFDEYKGINDKLGYLTKQDISELDKYCTSRFIELIPSVSSFGHLYHLLQNDKYRHLCELPDYTPEKHYWSERMAHHTINPEKEESFELIKSMLDQYIAVSSSDIFNICCDETFDLGTGVNSGRDKSELYISFVKKLVGYLVSKGKKVMMWGDIILQHPERINELPEDVIFLNWNYSKNPSEEQFQKIFNSGRQQILCPGTTSWNSFIEDIEVEEGNIQTLSDYAYKYNSAGLLVTNWGDFGNIAFLDLSLYGLVLGASLSWNKSTRVNTDFRRLASQSIFSNPEILDKFATLSEIKGILNWSKAVLGSRSSSIEEPEYTKALDTLCSLSDFISNADFSSAFVKREALNAIDGFKVLAAICAFLDGYTLDTQLDTSTWCKEYCDLWNCKNKPGELDEIIKIIKQGMNISTQ